jgi:hypothetical protein
MDLANMRAHVDSDFYNTAPDHVAQGNHGRSDDSSLAVQRSNA